MRLFSRRIPVQVILLTIAVLSAALVVRSRSQGAPAQFTLTIYPTYAQDNLLVPTAVYFGTATLNHNNTSYLFISDTGHHQIKLYDLQTNTIVDTYGNGTAGFVNSTSANSEFDYPSGLSGPGVVTAEDPFYHVPVTFVQLRVWDGINNVLRLICKPESPEHSIGCSTDSVTTLAGNGTAGYVDGPVASAEFQRLTSSGEAISTTQTLIADPFNNVIRLWDSGKGTVSTYAGNGTEGFVNGPASSAEFSGAANIAADSSGNLGVADTANFVIRKIDTSGNVTTLAGNGTQGYLDGPAASAEFAMPTSVIYNATDGYWYVADSLNNCIRRIDSSGNVSTYAGQQTGGFTNGALSVAQFSSPTMIAISGTNMYVADSNNNAIRVINMSTGTVSTLLD